MVAKRPSETLKEVLDERKIGPSKFGEMVGGDYLLAYRWMKGDGFDANPRNQKRAAKALGLPLDHFAQPPDEAARAEQHRKATFESFCTGTELGRSLSDDERASLDSHRFYGGKPSVSYYQTALGLIRGIIPSHLRDETNRINKAADDEIERKKLEEKALSEEDDSEPPPPPAPRSPKRTTRDKRGKAKPKK